MNTLSDILGAIIGYGLGIGLLLLGIATLGAMLGLAFPKLRKKEDDDSD